jgi:hypothetical protein
MNRRLPRVTDTHETMIKLSYRAARLLSACIVVLGTLAGQALADAPAGHGHGSHRKSAELGTSAAIDGDGRIWAVSKQTSADGAFVVLQTSTDLGNTWSEPRRIQKNPEPVAAGGEARPHIVLGPNGEIYISYTKTVAFPHIGDIRFVRSLDGGRTFLEPLTVHANRDVVAHSFESMAVDAEGRIFIAWIDGRDAATAKKQQRPYAGSALYYAVSDDKGASFRGDYRVADHSCECCRIALTLDPKGKPVAMWRHVFAPNIRDHALAELGADGKASPIERVSFDDWRIDACPHHGPSLAFAQDGTRHQVWFNGKEGDEGGALYASATPAGRLGKPQHLGSAQASHPDVAVLGNRVAVVWKQFDGQSTAILLRLSEDGGANWQERELARTAADSDKPHLIMSSSQIVLLWRTQSEGLRIVPIVSTAPAEKGKS